MYTLIYYIRIIPWKIGLKLKLRISVPLAEDTDEIWSSLAQLALDICAGQASVLQVLDDQKPPSSAKRLEKMISS